MDSKLRDLLEVARSKTESGALQWKAFSSDAFHTRIGAGSLHLHHFVPAYDNTVQSLTYGVQISDSLGRIVADEDIPEGAEDYAFVNQLFQAVRKSALKSDRVIDDMIHALRGG